MPRLFLLFAFLNIQIGFAQKASEIIGKMPLGTIVKRNIAYISKGHPKQVLDLYLPEKATPKTPLVVWVHGGAWNHNDQLGDMGYMPKTIYDILSKGYAIASIDYRFSNQAVFPAQIQDCYSALHYLAKNLNKENYDSKKIILIGFSAGGHLASLMGLANNNALKSFYNKSQKAQKFNIKGVINFYGPMDLTLFPNADNEKSPETQLLGATPVSRPDLAEKASPLTYIDQNDPPFLTIHGEKDDLVSTRQSQLLHSWLQIKKVPSELIIVKDAPHYGEMFDNEFNRKKIADFLADHFK